jgi:hypothetical protein
MAPTLSAEPSNYMQTLTRYLSNIMNSTLLGLPREIKELIYFDALSHASTIILALPLDPEVKKINPNAMILKDNLEELMQTVELMRTAGDEEYYEAGNKQRRFGRVDALNAPRILEKYVNLSFGPFFAACVRLCLLQSK